MSADPFLQALPPDAGLPPALRQLHRGEGTFSGRCRIERGKGALVALALRVAGFPPGGADVPVTLRIAREGQAWIWQRNFAGHVTRSRLRYVCDIRCVREDFGALTVYLRPSLTQGRLKIDICRMTIGGLPVPAFLLPRSATVEWQDDQGRFRFDVSASAPALGMLIRYQGWLTPVHDPPGKL